MKRFVFRLASVLRVREFEFDRARIRLAELERERTRRQVLVEAAASQLEQGHEILERESREGVDGERLGLRATGVSMGRKRLEAARVSVAQLEPPILEAKEGVRRTRSRVRSLEKLRERRSDEHRRSSLASEQAEIEELAMARIAHGDPSKGHAPKERIG